MPACQSRRQLVNRATPPYIQYIAGTIDQGCPRLRDLVRFRFRRRRKVDFNQLYFDHQILQMQADTASKPRDRVLSQRNASAIAGRIGLRQHELGAAASVAWTALAVVPLGESERLPGTSSIARPVLHLRNGGVAET